MGIIRRILNFITFKEDECQCPRRSDCIVDRDDGWKRETTQDHGKLVEEHLKVKAYLIAEKDGFRKDPAVYWEEAQRV